MNFLEEMKRYVRFESRDEDALRRLVAHARPWFCDIADVFYARILEHDEARGVLTGHAQVERLKATLQEWLESLLDGPWDEAYFEQRSRIGRVHVQISLPQRYMFAAMDVVRLGLCRIATTALPDEPEIIDAIHKILDIELAIMLETYVGGRTWRAERLAALGTMAAGLAHEIRNPLNAAMLQLTLVKRRLARATANDLSGAGEAAEIAASEMKRLALLVEDFLQFARPQPLRSSLGNLRTTAEVIVALLTPEAANAGVDLVLEPGAPVLTDYDDEKVKQVLLNLVRNAIEATGMGGRVRVRVGTRRHHALVEVEDDGRGLPTPEAPIFEPFFTTKPTGTGLGLAIAHRIVTDHGGRIEVESKPRRTVFEVVLPLR